MKILLFGKDGQLGQALKGVLSSVGEVKACGRSEADLTKKEVILSVIESFKPNIIVNAAAYTAVDQAEKERELAFQVNAEAIGLIANEAAKRDIFLIHYSTDYVFDGEKAEAYVETDTTKPVNVYGQSKLAGEQFIIKSKCKHLIFRTSWVIGKEGNNFAKTILRLAAKRSSLNIIDDQYGVPSSTSLIAKVTTDAIKKIANNSPWPAGAYHLSPKGKITWYGLAKALIKIAESEGLTLSTKLGSLHPISTSEYPVAAKRPQNSLLNTEKLNQQLTFTMPHWEEGFLAVAREIIREFKAA